MIKLKSFIKSESENCEKTLYFKDDNEFENFAINKSIIVNKSEISNSYYYDWDFTDEYKEHVLKGTSFIIEDEKSLITKRQSVTYKLITKKVQNLGEE